MLKETVYPASRTTGALILLVSLAFVAAGIAMLAEEPLMAGLGIAFFSLGALLGGAMLMPGMMALKLDAAGFEMRAFGRSNRTAWQDVASFQMISVHNQEMIGVTYRSGHRHESKVSRSVSGSDGIVPSSYQIPKERLLAELRGWHSQYGRPNQS